VDRDSLDEVFEAASELREALDRADDAGVVLSDATGTFRVRNENESELRTFLLEPLGALRSKIMRFVSVVRSLLERVGEESGDEAVIWECKAVLRRLDGIAEVCMRFVEYRERPQEVIWIERNRTSRGEAYARFISTPLDVAPVLLDALYLPNKTVACVSATLTVAGSFSFWLGRVGLDALPDRETLSGIFPSPFPYKSSVLLAAPGDAPLPDDAEYREFVDGAVVRLVEASGGSALVLFTSYDAMRSSFAKAVTRLEAQGIRCLRQGDDDRSRLLRNFIEDESSVLFATDSFWEGVDAPGDTLRLVVLCRLPFRSPNEPVFEARREDLEKRGENAFMRLSLPESVMKFKQGFGRLMRRGSDRGAVVVLDGRLLRKRYGGIFLKSLPETRESFKDFEEMLADVERFLSE
jgi:ATP-dependent DNA helicase DinG